ncbi:DNA-binding MarR family transcriptional regulator [Scopulibacillus daqui]|uniref:DNA-binding MarR family transcriptional regulator n=1 Tax=Scopulibacillus daqui TaxID=1469162 RepID=A0ABS2Q4H5_9BACL|nr:MarR family winged helix-turn-helix transcriptional regulator [Scopulibacillus daqui]MBM7646855.1 DNA-binding MarR family transcriptional regulator [Scopulibacillus daqui]
MELSELNRVWSQIYFYLRYDYNEDITHRGVRILQQVKNGEYVTIKEISEKLQISHNTASEHVSRLIKKGYIQKERDNKDRRKTVLSLTPKGSEVLVKHTCLDESKLDKIFSLLSKEEQNMIMSSLKLLEQKGRDIHENRIG